MAELVGTLNGSVEFTPLEIAQFPRVAWLTGAGVPEDSLGADGDLYLDGASGDIYQKENGTWA